MFQTDVCRHEPLERKPLDLCTVLKTYPFENMLVPLRSELLYRPVSILWCLYSIHPTYLVPGYYCLCVNIKYWYPHRIPTVIPQSDLRIHSVPSFFSFFFYYSGKVDGEGRQEAEGSRIKGKKLASFVSIILNRSR